MKWDSSAIPTKATKPTGTVTKDDNNDFADGKHSAREVLKVTKHTPEKLSKAQDSMLKLQELLEKDPEHAPFYKGLLETYDEYIKRFLGIRVSANRERSV